MSLRGYKKKGRPAIWLQCMPEKALRTAASIVAERMDFAKGFNADKSKPKVQSKFRKPIRNRTPSRAKEERIYVKEARAFVEYCVSRGWSCPVVACIKELREGRKYGYPISAKLNEIHHIHGRAGKLLRFQKAWVAVSKQGHRWIHSNPEEARRYGWLGPVGTWNDFERAKAFVEGQNVT